MVRVAALVHREGLRGHDPRKQSGFGLKSGRPFLSVFEVKGTQVIASPVKADNGAWHYLAVTYSPVTLPLISRRGKPLHHRRTPRWTEGRALNARPARRSSAALSAQRLGDISQSTPQARTFEVM
jgi:hypothetical protein